MGAMIARRAVAAAALIGATGCAASPEQIASLTGVTPPAIYSDVRFDMAIAGTNFWAAYEIDTVGGSGNIDESAYRALLRPADQEGADTGPIAATSRSTIPAATRSSCRAGSRHSATTPRNLCWRWSGWRPRRSSAPAPSSLSAFRRRTGWDG